MFRSDQRWLSALTAATIALWPLVGEAQTTPEVVVAIEQTAPVTARMAPGWLERAAERNVPRLIRSMAVADSAFRVVQQPSQRKRSWIGRHPVLFGTLVGFGGGFLTGYAAGDDGIFDDYVASFNGLVMGGIGAGTGAALGAVVEAATK